ncbi:hypothetical protein BC828DRAFT_404435 [Blastocladiella britannica]|nr:hypothetical protein BC828DRAFT_404435 [Blastocladiella britannica]
MRASIVALLALVAVVTAAPSSAPAAAAGGLKAAACRVDQSCIRYCTQSCRGSRNNPDCIEGCYSLCERC